MYDGHVWPGHFGSLLASCKLMYAEAFAALCTYAVVTFRDARCLRKLVSKESFCLGRWSKIPKSIRMVPAQFIRSLVLQFNVDGWVMNSSCQQWSNMLWPEIIVMIRDRVPRLQELHLQGCTLSDFLDVRTGILNQWLVKPLCCMRRLRSVQFSTRRVASYLRAKAEELNLEIDERLEEERQKLLELTAFFTANCDRPCGLIKVPEGWQGIHGKGECTMYGDDAGKKVKKRMLHMKRELKVEMKEETRGCHS